MFGVPSGVLLGAVALGALHGAEPGHGWPVAAAYAADRANRWLAGAVAGLVIGTGHLVSSLAVVGVFFLLKSRFAVDAATEPLEVGSLTVGSPIGILAGLLLLGLAVREYRGGHGHSHGHGHPHGGHSHDHSHDDHSHGHGHDHPHDGHSHDDRSHEHDGHSHDDHSHEHDHDHSHDDRSHEHDHDHSHDAHGVGDAHDDHTDADGESHHELSATDGLWGITVSAFVLGFAHEEEFEIIAICAGTDACLTAMGAYAGTVVVVITLATLLLVAGLERFEDRVQRAAEYFPLLSATVLAVLGVGFLLGVL